MKSNINKISNLERFNLDSLKNCLMIAYKLFIEPFTISNPSRIQFSLGLIFFVVYCCILVLAHFYLYNDNIFAYGYLIVFAVITVAFILVCIIRRIHIRLKNHSKQTSLIVGLIFFAFTFLNCFLWQLAFWPGSFSPDSISQYTQAIAGNYNNWHPIIHTILFFKLPLLLCNKPFFIITFQIFIFSIAVGYLFYTLFSFGISLYLCIIAFLFITLNPNNSLIMLFPWKDCAFGIFSLILFTFLIHLFIKRKNISIKLLPWIVFAVLAFLTNSMRHNAVLLVIPIYIILIIFFKECRKKILISFTIFMCFIFGSRFLLENGFNARYEKTPQIELLGIPMTILCDEYKSSPDSLQEETKMFLKSIGSSENWDNYELGDFNSIKFFSKNINNINQSNRIFSYLKGIDSSGYKVAIQSFIRATSLVWNIDKFCAWGHYNYICENDFNIIYTGRFSKLKDFFLDYRKMVLYSPFIIAFGVIGIINLVLICLFISNIGKIKYEVLCLTIPPLVYNFGTMLLLSGKDFRFFYFNFLVIIPIMFLLLIFKGCTHEPKL